MPVSVVPWLHPYLAHGNAYLLTNSRLLWQLPPGTLPKIAEVPTGAALYPQAVECVEALVDALNREVTPVIERLERS